MRFSKLDGHRHQPSKIDNQHEPGVVEPCTSVSGSPQRGEVLQIAAKLRQLADALREQIVATEDTELRHILMAELGKIEMRRAYDSQAGRMYLKKG